MSWGELFTDTIGPSPYTDITAVAGSWYRFRIAENGTTDFTGWTELYIENIDLYAGLLNIRFTFGPPVLFDIEGQPKQLTVIQLGTKAKLTWDFIPDAEYYVIHGRRPSSGMAQPFNPASSTTMIAVVANTTNTFVYHHDGAGTYDYQVFAVYSA